MAEIADKTQLLVLTLSRRYSLPTLLIGMSVPPWCSTGSPLRPLSDYTSAALSDIRRIGAILFCSLLSFASAR
ncbi:MAG: hypothetical protein ACLVJ6_02475 [Merdibacter sp.]